MRKKGARIVLDRYVPPPKSWNWRDDWYTKHDSAYSLFSKFAFLNAFAASDLIRLFVSPGSRTTMLQRPQIDLRDPSKFDLAALSIALRADIDTVAQSFLFAMLPNSRRKAADHLRWCKKCAAIGFHSPLFQIEVIHDCPIHAWPLLSGCPSCKAKIPYRLSRQVLEMPFGCPFCGHDFAPVLRHPKTRALELSYGDIERLNNVSDLLKLEDQFIPMKLEFSRIFKNQGAGELVIAPADMKRHYAHYTAFFVQVLDEIRSMVETMQPPLGLDPMTQIVHGQRMEPLNGAFLRKRHRKAIKEVTALGISHAWDDMLMQTYRTYAAIRRFIWRRVVLHHQTCITSAAKQLWWHMEGETTPCFCPVAEAFIRWRMYWEGCGVPRQLFEPMRKAPLGIVGWHAHFAPICPAGWSRAAELWVTKHIFARSCISSFHDWLEVAMSDAKSGKIQWSRHAASGKNQSYWALSGHDSWQIPVRIYMQSGEQLSKIALPICGYREHREHHLTQIMKIKR